MNQEIRTKDYKLFDDNHGIVPKDRRSEKAMTRDLYWNKKPLRITQGDQILEIKLIGYEVPLGAKIDTQSMMDLVGIDEDNYIYIIEAKKSNNNDSVKYVINVQINPYESFLEKCLPFFELELRQQKGFENIAIKGIKKMLLAPVGYFRKQYRDIFIGDTSDTMLCYFANSEEYMDIASISNLDGSVELSFYEP
ncbi:MAG: hypothetical protein CVU48_04110 [Candidatus Cloacimonetes bacterium HGW-Cloacimonetes-1]|jgi:hypothetical protein|nr:MAG: hypothetical protein CVU48_04110 [Candidatus Cloacimonetes bacterium HGW-Cloacimonetes-1]